MADNTHRAQCNDSETEAQYTTINTTRFGEVRIDLSRIIHFPEGILGFPDEKRFVILEHKPGSPFCWLQSVDTPELAFVMMDPLLVKDDYLTGLPAPEKQMLEGEGEGKYALFSFVTIPRGEVQKMTINLLGPIFIDVESKIGRQLVLANSDYDTRYPVFGQTK